MAKVLMLARTFPAYHPSAGTPTYFVEKFLNGLPDYPPQKGLDWWGEHNLFERVPLEIALFPSDIRKFHTIRAGNRFKVGDKFSPRVWEGRPYASKQIIIAPDVEVVKVWDINIYVPNKYFRIGTDTFFGREAFRELAQNDGLSINEFEAWFPKPFTGQIICWNPIVKY